MTKAILYSYWRSSCSWRVRIGLHLKEIPYEMRTVDILKPDGEQHTSEFRKINPMSKVPALHIDNRTLIESMSILQYLEETRPQNPLMPKDLRERIRVREICEVIVSGIQPLQNIGLKEHVGDENWLNWTQLWINKGFTALEDIISTTGKEYCVGDNITLADCCLVPQVYNAKNYRVNMSLYPSISRINKNLENHPAFLATHPNNQPGSPKTN
ncbi:probable maleylacetoacetate isomerase 2 isoform X2 [Belonocnema kinseyi]|uniref:probable maleylacetoacetate isomerase 2 isoform X2 n=1 Tax=Belonocnema kinseyi TaxID=2817044 RepID=UPI00143D761D|nr:probable maleylacetoacetate isomerase 2 isoform X2 [Belonocnema kinseyi]